jgi:Ser-tRNA(Ala) deacylase AlaX
VNAENIGEAGLRKPTERSGDIRLIDITGFDRSACGGTHVRMTGEIGPILGLYDSCLESSRRVGLLRCVRFFQAIG